jgi:hypothetical protein
MKSSVQSNQLVFNIIYTPGTARYLSPFVLSLLHWSDCSYRLIANGLPDDECRFLEQLSATDEQLEFLTLPGPDVLLHGDALEYLQARTEVSHFCFLDSDILATGPFLPQLLAELMEADSVSSCPPLWYSKYDMVLPAAFQQMDGSHHVTDTGICIGGTFFAIYDNAILSECLSETGLSFHRYAWGDLPLMAQTALASMGLQKNEYDTGKVLNLMLLNRGARLRYKELDELCHIGGISEAGTRDKFSGRVLGERVARRMPGPLAGPALKMSDAYYSWRNGLRTSPWQENRVLIAKARKRAATAWYFYRLLQGLVDGLPLPELPRLGNPSVERRIASVSDQIITWYEKSIRRQETAPTGRHLS